MADEHTRISESCARLITWLEGEQFRGYDPYDALNSPLLGALGLKSHALGVVFTQLVRRSPINFRPLLGIAPGSTPKAMGLFLAAFVRRYAALREPHDLERAHFFANWLREHVTATPHGVGWGWGFDWANRTLVLPRGTPTIVNTAFIGQALCDYAQECDAPWAFELARRACDFILHDLNRLTVTAGVCFSYTSLDRRYVHNANLLGAALLARVGVESGEDMLIETARCAVNFTVGAQVADGSWCYGVAPRDGWVDNFHTGFVLRALADVIDLLGCDVWKPALARGYLYWQEHFFRADGAPKYYAHALYPIDIHSVAEAVLVSLRMHQREQATRTLLWGIEHFQDAAGYFYYQRTQYYVNRIPYLRWSNAWMLRALAEWLWGDAVTP